RKRQKQAESVAAGCHRLPETFMVSRASAVGCHPLQEVPSLRGKGSTSCCIGQGYLLLLQSAHGHGSQPQPVHALRIMDRFIGYPPARGRFVSRREKQCTAFTGSSVGRKKKASEETEPEASVAVGDLSTGVSSRRAAARSARSCGRDGDGLDAAITRRREPL